ncbi:MAG: hypothetical protein MJA82_10315 [Clostridia bacterium]|nr:hypothetical protein [Clostridia bacterium]
MKKLSINSFNRAYQVIGESARPLEKRILKGYFDNIDNDMEILNELQRFQNEDGGFGNSLEADFRLPSSSPMATSIAFEHLVKYDNREEALDMIKSGIKYLEKNFIPHRNGWFAVPKDVNNFPHGPWWHYMEKSDMTLIDNNWGNPTSQIIGYLYKYSTFVSNLDVQKLLDYAIDYFVNKNEFQSEHEIYCYIKLYEFLPDNLKNKIEGKLTFAIQSLVCTKRDEWDKYTPQPLHFVEGPKSHRFGISNRLLEENLDYLIDSIESNGKVNPPWNWHNLKAMIDPHWDWNAYDEEWAGAKQEWIGVLTLNALITLDRFNRIEKPI